MSEMHTGSAEDQHDTWPAFVDLFSATSLLFIAFVGVFIFLLLFQEGVAATNRDAILQHLTKRSQKGRLFEVDSSDQQFVRIVLKERATFDFGQYRWESLRDSGRVALRTIANVLADDKLQAMYREVRILGHSDQSPYPGTAFSNWELSASRAAVVARFLVAQPGVDACKLSATGLGPYHPIDVRQPELNRRIEIQIVPSLAHNGAPQEGGVRVASDCYPPGDRRNRPFPR
jgi:outer membrane protein OmpA-like peptidoglycan-associated protein